MLRVETIHHVSLPVTDLARSRRFYGGVLGLPEIERPPFATRGAWYQCGDRQLHLIVGEHSTFRASRRIDTGDVHLAIRVASYRAALAHLASHGYAADAADELLALKEQPTGAAGFPQLFLLDPDRNVIEINAARLD
ncbi:MAG TPA: VOC family protein [Gemmatimonadaceae bacterium]|nr:VOC family protein [Gemmatimonadaceae bacterium]